MCIRDRPMTATNSPTSHKVFQSLDSRQGVQPTWLKFSLPAKQLCGKFVALTHSSQQPKRTKTPGPAHTPQLCPSIRLNLPYFWRQQLSQHLKFSLNECLDDNYSHCADFLIISKKYISLLRKHPCAQCYCCVGKRL